MPPDDALFLPLPDPPPPAADALEAAYAAFGHYPRPTGVGCRDCFDGAAERRIVRPVPARDVEPAVLRMILAEHIDCSVGTEGFLYFLPRILETLGLHWLGPGIGERIATAGGPRLPLAERAALAGCLARAAFGVARDGDGAPLGDTAPDGSVRSEAGRNVVGEVGASLVQGLVAVRVEPSQLFRRLLAREGANLGLVLADLVDDASFVTPFATKIHARHPDHPAPEPALVALDAVARRDFVEVVTADRFARAVRHADRRLPARKRERVVARYRTLVASPAPARDALVAALSEALARPAPG